MAEGAGTVEGGQVKQDDINTLVPLLNGVTAEWNKFGVYLPVHFDDIKNIKRGGPITDVKDCLNDVLDWYSKKQGPKKWTDIVKALKDIRNFDLASRIPQTGDVPVNDAHYISKLLFDHSLKEISSQWRPFGLALGIPVYELKTFNPTRSSEECMEMLLSVWIERQQGGANVSAIIQACQAMGNWALADDLQVHPEILKIKNRKLKNAVRKVFYQRDSDDSGGVGCVVFIVVARKDKAEMIDRHYKTEPSEVNEVSVEGDLRLECESNGLKTSVNITPPKIDKRSIDEGHLCTFTITIKTDQLQHNGNELLPLTMTGVSYPDNELQIPLVNIITVKQYEYCTET